MNKQDFRRLIDQWTAPAAIAIVTLCLITFAALFIASIPDVVSGPAEKIDPAKVSKTEPTPLTVTQRLKAANDAQSKAANAIVASPTDTHKVTGSDLYPEGSGPL